jgi:DNA-binding transcriptional LysR family regulator
MNPLEDLSLLRAFVAIVESGSISGAARSLKIPQPSLSRHLRTLEDRCSVVLLRRDTHRMSLTEAGHRLLADAKGMLTLADDAAQRLHEDRAALRGHLRLFATVDSGQFTVTRLIARFLRANPGVTAELSYANRPLHMIQEGYDAGVITGDITDESVVARPAGKVVRYLVAAPDLIATRPAVKQPADLKTWPWIALAAAQFGGSRKMTLSAPKHERQTLHITPIFVSEGVTSLREAARAGVGVGALPDWLAREDLLAGRIIRVLPQWNLPAFPVHVICPAQRTLPARVRAFVDFAVTYMTKEMHAPE